MKRSAGTIYSGLHNQKLLILSTILRTSHGVMQPFEGEYLAAGQQTHTNSMALPSSMPTWCIPRNFRLSIEEAEGDHYKVKTKMTHSEIKLDLARLISVQRASSTIPVCAVHSVCHVAAQETARSLVMAIQLSTIHSTLSLDVSSLVVFCCGRSTAGH